MKVLIGSIIATIILQGCGGGSTTPQTSGSQQIEDKGEKETLTPDKDGKLKTIQLAGDSKDIAVNKDALFVAKGKDGIDVLKIGYKDALSSELINKIDGINAKKVTLSEDGKRLYVVNAEGFVNIINIENVAHPVKERTTTQQDIKKEILTENKKYKFVPKDEKGLEIYSMSGKTATLESTFNKSNAYDVVLADQDTKALIAAGSTGINLLDITSPTQPNMVVNFAIAGGTKGLSLNKEQGILFVANGDKGVLVYSLNVILDKLTK